MSGPVPPPRFAGHRLGSSGYRRIRFAMLVAAVATFAQLYGIQPLMPLFAKDFQLDPATSALTMSLAAVGLGVALLIAGPLSEVFGRATLMHSSLAASAVFAVGCALAPTWPVLLVLRTLQGVALAGLPAVAMAYLSEEIHPTSLARAAGLYVGGTALGGMSGRFLVGYLADQAGWRAALVGLGVLSMVCAGTVVASLPSSRNFHPAAAHPLALAHRGLSLFRDPALVTLFGVGFAAMGTFVGLFNAAVFRLEQAPFNLSSGAISLVFVVHIVGSTSSAWAGRQADRSGFRAVAPLAAIVLLLGVLFTLTTTLPLIIAALAVVSAGFFAVHGVAAPWVAARARRGVGGTAQASSGYLFFFYAGSSVFGGLAPAAWSSGGWSLVVALCAGLAAVTLALTLLLGRIPAIEERAQPDQGTIGS